ncbi:hypothetical protein Hypma_010928 [Hypsizygus marmoreus]|uniref:Uncharacterized protein n=1 Tax=Hypsizygus marmoreus TaxID=39966 RepID=A0A369JHV1_HYPMA|nr:hypothetical protein Hypma_010928 [Hypsizygus marmoreus]
MLVGSPPSTYYYLGLVWGELTTQASYASPPSPVTLPIPLASTPSLLLLRNTPSQFPTTFKVPAAPRTFWPLAMASCNPVFLLSENPE